MGLFSSIRKGIKKAANAVSRAVNKATDAVADVVETIGNGVGDALSWVGTKIPGVGGVFGWLGDIVASVTDLVSSIVKGVGSIVGGLLSGALKIVGGIVTWDWGCFAEGWGDLFAGIAGAVINIGGKAIAVVQGIFTVGRARPLNADEVRIIRLVFQDSIATYNVRAVDGHAGVFHVNDRPFVLGNTIYLKNLVAAAQPAVFAHECVHVWQNQHLGSGFTADALAGQWWGANYDWESEAKAGREWVNFEMETQGESIEAVYASGGTVLGVIGSGAFFAEPDEAKRVFTYGHDDWTALANGAVRVIRDRTPWRVSGWLE